MSAYIDMIGAERLTIAELDALESVIELGLADYGAAVRLAVTHGVFSQKEFALASEASTKLSAALRRAKLQLEPCELCGRSGKIPHRSQPHMGMCSKCGRVPD